MNCPALWPGAQGLELPDRLAPQAVQLADRHHQFTFEQDLQLAQLEGRSAQPAQLLAQTFCRKRLFFGFRQRHR